MRKHDLWMARRILRLMRAGYTWREIMRRWDVEPEVAQEWFNGPGRRAMRLARELF